MIPTELELNVRYYTFDLNGNLGTAVACELFQVKGILPGFI